MGALDALDFRMRCECEWQRPGEVRRRRCVYTDPARLVALVTLDGTVSRRLVCDLCVERLQVAGRLVEVWKTPATLPLSV